MCDSEDNGGKKKKMPAGQLFTPMNARQAQEASVRARNLRRQMRAQILQAAVDEGIDKLFQQAIKKKDMDLLNLVEKGLKLTGLDFASSEDAVQKLDVKSDNKVDSKLEVTISGVE